MNKNALAHFWDHFTSPLATEPDKARQEHMSKVILVILSLLAVVFSFATFLGWLNRVIPLDTFLILLGLSFLFVLGWRLAHKGHWQIGSYIPIVLILLTAAYGNYVGGIDAPAMLLYALSIVLAVILKERPVQWCILVLSLVLYIGFGLAHAFDILSTERSAETLLLNRLTITIVVLISITLSLQFLDTQFRNALARSRQQALEVHSQSERIRGMFESAQDGIIFADLEGTIIDANESALRLAQIEHKEALLHHSLLEFIVPEDRELAETNIRRIVEPDRGTLEEYRILSSSGGFRHIEVNTALLVDESGEPSGFVAIFRDITDRKKAEEALRRSEGKYRLLIENAPLGIVAVNTLGQITETNSKLVEILGSPSKQATQDINVFEFPNLIDAGIADDFKRCIEFGRPIANEHPYTTKWEKRMFLRYHLNPIRDENGQIIGLQGILEDVTQQKQIEEIMLQSAKLASIGGLAAGMAHEINNPLSAMVQSAQMLELILDPSHSKTREKLAQNNLDPDSIQRYLEQRNAARFLEGIRTSGTRAAKIVTDLLSFSRKETDDMTVCDLNELVETTLELAATDYDLKKHYDFRRIEIIRNLAPDLPALSCEKQQVQQVILNLLRNAAQAMADNTDPPRLTIRTSVEDEWFRLEIEDNGGGIPDDIRDRLFEPFFTTKDIGQGTGLGLWLCWSIVVERHRGRIHVKPVKNNSSCFIVELPLQAVKRS